MHYPTVDTIIQTLNKSGPGSNTFKVDISQTFSHIHMHLGHGELLDLGHRVKLYIIYLCPLERDYVFYFL